MEPAHSQPAPGHAVAGVGEAARLRRVPTLNLLLFGTTFLTTALTSALNQGADILSDPAAIRVGFPFAIAVMTILLFHECGHYYLARAHQVDASLPYFIPAPPIFVFGTLGAFIRMRRTPPTRSALFDIGAAGPWAGFVVAVPAVIFGLQLSEVRPLDPTVGGLMLGDSLLFSGLTWFVLGVSSEEATILLHPIALAGWFGFLVTCLNLLPVGQLDGGHVAYAVFGRSHRWISRAVLVVLVLLGITSWPGWFVWAALLLVLGLAHPQTTDSTSPLDRRRLVAAALTLGLFIVTFTPEPLTLAEPKVIPRGERLPAAATAPLPDGRMPL